MRGSKLGAPWCVGRALPPLASYDAAPLWKQADPSWIRDALRHTQALPSGGWHALDLSSAITRQPRAFVVAGRSLVVWRDGDRAFAAPNACPHMGAPLDSACVKRGALICPWHGLALGPRGHGAWRPLTSFDDGVLFWARLPSAGELPTVAPLLPARPRDAVSAALRIEVACEPADVIANRLDPWHGTQLHPYAFASLRVVGRLESEVTVRVAYRVVGPFAVEVDARFHCPDPRTIAMTIVRGEGVGSVVETHATPLSAGRTAVLEAVFATSDRPGWNAVLATAWALRPWLTRRAARLWRDDSAYAARTYALRRQRIER